MITRNLIIQTLDQLPEKLWQEVLDFILFLLQKQAKSKVIENEISSENIDNTPEFNRIDKPQLIFDRDRVVVAFVDIKTFQNYLEWRQQHQPSSELAERLAELQQICIEEDYTLEVPPRIDRPNAVLEILE
jgi:Protein of unknown function (DUF2281)